MPLTAPSGAVSLPVELLEPPLQVLDVLYEAESPVIFTMNTKAGRMLAYVADEVGAERWLLLSPCSDRLLEDLREGRIPVLDALVGGWTWLVRLDAGVVSEAWAVNAASLPLAYLPTPGVFLLPEFEPVLSTRAEGAQITRASTPASVVAYVADATCKALKGILDFVLDNEPQGRPTDGLRAQYDLPVHSLAFGSFQIAFAAPPTGLFPDQNLTRAIRLLQTGLQWAVNATDAPSPGANDEERGAVLRAILRLTPPSTGVIEQIDVAGQWMTRGIVRLKRTARKRVLAELRKVNAERFVVQIGRVGELDKNGSFILRDTESGHEVRGSYEEDLYDELMDYFASNERITVIGIERSGRLYAAVVKPEATATEEDTP